MCGGGTSNFLWGGGNALEYQGLFKEHISGCSVEHITHNIYLGTVKGLTKFWKQSFPGGSLNNTIWMQPDCGSHLNSDSLIFSPSGYVP